MIISVLFSMICHYKNDINLLFSFLLFYLITTTCCKQPTLGCRLQRGEGTNDVK